MHQHGGFALGAQAVEHAQHPRGLARQHRFAQLEHVVAGDVEHGRFDILEAQLALRVEQRQLLQLLVRGQQVAFDPVGKEGQCGLALRVVVHPLALRGQTLSQPGGQGAALDRIDLQADAVGIERAEPGGLLLLPVQPGQVDDGQHVVAALLGIALQRLAAILARLAVGDADLDQLAIGEQAHRLLRAQQRRPIGMRATEVKHLALGVASPQPCGADRVTRLLRQQRLVAVDGVERLQAARQMGAELVGADIHALLNPA